MLRSTCLFPTSSNVYEVLSECAKSAENLTACCKGFWEGCSQRFQPCPEPSSPAWGTDSGPDPRYLLLRVMPRLSLESQIPNAKSVRHKGVEMRFHLENG